MCFVFIDHVDMSQYHTIHHNPKLMNIPTLKPFCSFLYSSWGFHVFYIFGPIDILQEEIGRCFLFLCYDRKREVCMKTQTVAGTQRWSAAVFTSLASKSEMTSNTATPLAVSIWTWGAQPECRTGTFCHSKHIRKRDSTTKQQGYNLQTRVSKPSHDC